MKCQKCGDPAVIHITEVLKGNAFLELHLCNNHAKIYLENFGVASQATAIAIGQQLTALTEKALETITGKPVSKAPSEKSCPECHIKLSDLKQKGRLGCPEDYHVFAEELEDLLITLQGANEHRGKKPKRWSQQQTLKQHRYQLQQEMQQAIETEDYEKAAELRDRMRAWEEGESFSS
ncbi:Hypothetical protein PBC10988_9690 [Planctomycetales bacterium 10988]|nr:Hypothetical protein PBC10988_9690 [Planctomycetales bacterium 10988]